MAKGLRAVAVSIGSALAVGGLAGVLVVVAQQPWAANHFGYALPGPHGLPFRVSYAGRYYANEHTCAGDGWCRSNGPLPCTTPDWLQSNHYWPLQRVGSVTTLFGPAHPLLRTPTPRGFITMGLYVPVERDCYLAYALEGGP